MNLIRRAASVGLVLVILGGAGIAQEADKPRAAKLHGSFIQFSNAQVSWTDDSWRQLLGYFARLGVSQVVVQWAVNDNTAYYPSAIHRPVFQPPLEKVLTLADELGMTVSVGLAHDPAYWTKVARNPEVTEVYLRTLRARSEGVAKELVPLVGKHRSFRGWYITEEIEDATWKKPDARSVVIAHVRELATNLRALKPDATIAISGFSNAETTPATFGQFWSDLLRAAPVDVLLFQDGIGVGKQALSSLPLYLAAARDAASRNGRQMQVVVEIFQQVTTTPAFVAVPAPLDRVTRQIDVAATYSSAPGPIAFSIPEYMTPLGGPDAQRLFEAYLARLNR
jgi:hypothetical protein